MSYFNIEMALAKKVQSLNLGCPTGKFGIPLTDDQKGNGLWVQPHNMTGQTTAVTCGYNGEDDYQGILQIDINYPIGQGSGKLLELADKIRKQFQAGDTMWFKGQWVKVRSCSLSPEIESGGFQKRYLSIVYYSRSVRHE